MKEENKYLLLRDLCGRLPYGVKLWHESFEDVIILHAIDATQFAVDISIDKPNSNTSFWNSIEQVKPYLFPLSSMTEEQRKEYYAMVKYNITSNDNAKLMDWLNKYHFDYRGFIAKGLAIDCTNLNIY